MNMGNWGEFCLFAYLLIFRICHLGLLPQEDTNFVPGMEGYDYV